MVPRWWPAALDVIWHMYSHLHCSMGDGGRESPSSGDVALTMGQVPCEFLSRLVQIQFFRGSRVKGPSSLALLKLMPQWPVALVVIWHIYLCLACSSEDSARDLPSSKKVVLGQGQITCEFPADWQNFIFQLVAPDTIWHIYSGQCCFKGFWGMDLLSSGDVALMMGQVPCEFWGDWPTFIFQPVAPDVIWHIYLHLYCSLRDQSRDLSSSREAAPTMGQVPCEFQADQPNFIFQPAAPDVIWHIYAHLYCSSRDNGRDLPSSAEAVPTLGKVPCEFQADWPECSFSGEELRQGSFQPWSAQDGASSMASGSRHNLAHLLTPVLLI